MLEKLFDADNAVYRIINRIADLIVLNLLFLCTCIPIVTIGPALTALYSVAMQLWEKEREGVIKQYFSAFKQNLRQGILLWLISLMTGAVCGSVLLLGIIQWKAGGQSVGVVLIICGVILLQIYLTMFVYIWPLQAKFENQVAKTLKNALAMGISHIPSTIGVWILFIIIAAIACFADGTGVSVVLIDISLGAYLQSRIFLHVVKPYLDIQD